MVEKVVNLEVLEVQEEVLEGELVILVLIQQEMFRLHHVLKELQEEGETFLVINQAVVAVVELLVEMVVHIQVQEEMEEMENLQQF